MAVSVRFDFFVVPEADSFLLGLVYFHVIADSTSIILLMRDFVVACNEGLVDEIERRKPISDYAWLWRYPCLIVKKIISMPSFIQNMSRSCRVPCHGPGDGTNGVMLFSLPPEQLRAVISTAKSWGHGQ